MTKSSQNFEHYLEKTGEVGFVEQVFPSLIYASGLPGVHPSELVMFESGEIGQVLSINLKYVEVLVFSPAYMKVGTRIARTDDFVSVSAGSGLLGTVVNPFGVPYGFSKRVLGPVENRYLDLIPSGINDRVNIKDPLETGISVVDLIVPLGKGQRELVIGDRKSGKSVFLLQALFNQAVKGEVCIYCLVGKRQSDIMHVNKYVKEKGVAKQTIIMASSASDSPGLIFLTPYAAMTIAEYFRDQGKNVVLILDDLTTHAAVYREIALLARRFPGRNSYPGDIFYVHSRLLERAGAFKKSTITALIAAETVMGDLSGYIQTNLMAITDGHLFFDIELFNQGIRPAVNPYLSVTRVGEQAQTPLVRDMGRTISRFLSHYQRLKELTHFGSEFEQRVKDELVMGDKINDFFTQSPDRIVPLPISIFAIGQIWGGVYKRFEAKELSEKIRKYIERYSSDNAFKGLIDNIISKSQTFEELVKNITNDYKEI
ncbi:MAG: ATP synthase subunit alpha [Candidatus Woesebacteria bacterium GW2011_GWB1_38_5b]|uniref:ATP synthase subunit alpha n=1 Tax=Candidatus Woesebacteria bacterium GW2011_GWB1_38_5b TaxID=1618569 RepID=A0A0G0NCM8_9BACT|nr:MAG: ATP synthase subunit alpha [Candidatus Woesebacteria bacterium GW2011_GWB1_38_5b]